MEKLNDLNLSSLSNIELENTQGAIVGIVLAAAALTLACLYYAGYAVGTLECNR